MASLPFPDAVSTINSNASNESGNIRKPSTPQHSSSSDATSQSTNVSSSSSSSNPQSSTTSSNPIADVETTNWNAVAMLASKYGINLRRSGEMNRPRPSDLEGGDQPEDDGVDLGIGTPFRITAKKEGDKIIYRFKSRGPSPAASSTSYPASSASAPSSSNRPRKAAPPPAGQSSPAAYSSNSKNQRSLKGSRSIPALRASGIFRGAALSNNPSSPSSSNSQDSSNPQSSHPQQQPETDLDALETSLNSGISPSAPGGGATGALAALGLGTRAGMSRDLAAANASKSRNISSAAGVDSSASTTQGGKNGRINEKSPGYGMPLQEGDVLGAILGLNDLIGGGGFKQDQQAFSSPKPSQQGSSKSSLIAEEIAEEEVPPVEKVSSPSAQSQTRSPSASPTRERRGLRRTTKGGLPSGSPSAAFSALSNSSPTELSSREGTGIGLGLSHSVDDPPTFQKSPPVFQRSSHPGTDGILLPRSTSAGEVPTIGSLALSEASTSTSESKSGLSASQRFNAASGVQSIPTSLDWDRSPIPQMQHLGQPLFDDLEAHASSFGLSSPIPESSLLGAKVEKDENLRRLREAQSWESSGTAKDTDISSYNQLKWSEYPQSLVPHLQANFRKESLESQIRESDEDRSDSEAVKKAPTSKSNSHLDMNLYCEEAFIFDVLQHYTQQGALAAARSQGVNVTKSITFADSSNPKTPDLSSNPNASTPSPNPNSSSRTPSSRRGSIAAALSPVKGSTTSNNSYTTSASDVSSSVSSAASGPSDNSSSVDNSSHVSQAQDTSASAAPGDDPRFSLWAVRANDAAGTLVLAGRDGVVAKIGSQSTGNDPSGSAAGSSSSRETGVGGQASGKRWSIKGNNGTETSAPGQDRSFKSSNPSYSGNSENVKDLILFPPGRSSLVAASSIRLVAELTSEIDHRLLTDFFYTYRPFLAPSSLLELLTLRFHWALSTPQGPHDEARRRIVIVRTYVVIKYWLLHFFEVDFLPNSALRKQLTTWLNNLAKDKSLPIRPADMSIIKSLKKVVRNLKETYSLMGVGGLLVNDAGKSPTSANLGQLSSSSGDDAYSPSTSSDPTRVSKTSSEGSHTSSSELKSPKMSEDVDLEFNGSSSEVQRTVTASRSGNAGQRRSVGESALGLGMVGDRSSAEAKKAVFSNNGASSWSEKEGDLGSTPGRRTNQYGSTSGLGTPLSVQAPPPPLPHSHNAISRVFVNTVGRLARFKRVLGTARASPFPFPNGPDAGLEDLEFEANDSGDLLFIRGGLENFINSFNLPPMAISPAIGRTGNEGEDQEGDESTDPENGISDGTTQDETPSLSTTSGKSRSTPASSLDLSSDAARIRAGLGIEAVDVEAEQFALDEEIRRSRRSRSGDDGMDGDAEDEGEFSPPMKQNLDAANLLSLQRLTESESRKPFSDHLHHATSEQTLRSISTVEPRRASPTSPARNVAASIRSQRSSEHPQFSRSGSRASIHSRKLASRLAFAPGAEMSRSNSRISTTSGGQPRIVQIDDIDLSSDEDDGVVRRALRRLPGARDLRMANHVHDLEPSRQSFDSLSNSSLGRVHAAHASISDFSLRSYAPSMVSLSAAAAAHASTARPAIGTVQTEMLDPDEALEGYELVRGFRLDGMDSDEDEPGDVEAALMRLEGVIDEEKQREKARRVERMWQDSQLRKAEDDERKKSRIQSRSSARDTRVSRSEGGESFEEDEGAAADEEIDSDQPTSQSLARQPSVVSRRTMEDVDEDSDSEPISDLATRTSRTNYDQQRSPPPSTIGLSPENGTPRSRTAALASSGRPTAPRASSTGTTRSNRPVSHAGIVYGSPSTTAASGGTGSWAQAQAAQQARAMDRAIASSKFGLWTLPPVHRSFLLGYRSEVIAQQLCLIEAELFKAVTWEELASDRWKERSASGGSEVVDWESFYQARVRERAEDKTGSYKERAVEAIIARFNLTCNWVVSEIVLTQNVEERAAVVAKLIRVAWKCYHQSNFASLTQIILGLQSPWVERLRKTWARIGMWEMRILRDLKNFTSPLRNFSLLRNALQGMVAQSGMEDLVTSAGPPQASGTQYQGQSGSQKARNAQGREIHVSDGCIPFFGLFISDLAVNDAFPSFIDPSCPSSVPETDSTGALVRLSKPDAFDHLQPLPPGVKLEPLINLYKFRVTAMTIKTVLAFQERAKAYKYEADGGVYVKCLKIRCLSGEQMTQISHHAEP